MTKLQIIVRFAVALAIAAGASKALADPAYTAKSLLAIFKKDKDAFEANKVKYRKVCLEGDTDPACGPPPTPTRVNLFVTFDFGSDHLTAAAKENLEQLADALKNPELKGTKFNIDGHTDARGTEDFNRALSERRARAVVAYLGDLGVDTGSLTAKGFGSSKLRVTADPYAGANRRVEAYVAP